MEITIKVNDKLFKKDASNKFQDFFGRVIADIAGSLNEESPKMCGSYEMETAALLQKAFYKAEYKIDE